MKVRSTTHRCRPSLAEVSTPRRAMRGMMERARQSRRHRRWSQALSTARQCIAKRCPERGMQLLGSLAGSPSTPRPHPRHGVERRCERHAVVTVRTGQRQAERRAAAVGDAVPLRARAVSIRRVRPRLVAPLLLRWMRRPAKRETNRARRPDRAVRAGRGAAGPTPLPDASPAAAASRSCPSSRTPRAAAFPTADPNAKRTRSRAGHPGPPPVRPRSSVRGIRTAFRGIANFRIYEVQKSPTPLAFGEFSNGGSGKITAGGYPPARAPCPSALDPALHSRHRSRRRGCPSDRMPRNRHARPQAGRQLAGLASMARQSGRWQGHACECRA